MNGLSLGIPGVGGISPGTHFCALYSGPAERDRLLFPFLDEGLRHGDKCLCLVDDIEPALVRDRVVGQPGPEYSRRSAQLDVERASDAYLSSGEFSVEDMMQFLSQSVDAAIADDFDLLRAAGEMSWVMPWSPGCDDLFLYESALNHAVEQVPAIFMCLYDLKKFGTGMLVEVLRTHPKVLLDRTVIDNPHYVEPAEYRPPAGAAAATRYPLVKVGAEGTDDGWASLTDAERRVVSRVSRGWLDGAIALDDKGFVLTGADVEGAAMFETASAGVFAVGDVRSGSVKRVSSAVGEGAVVVRLVYEQLVRAGRR